MVSRNSRLAYRDQRIRVLLIAEACNPEWVSVPLVGYNLFRALAQVADVMLVTQVRNRSAISHRMSGAVNVTFIDSELIAKPFHQLGRILTLGKNVGWTLKQAAMWLPYLYFEKLVFKRFGGALRRGEFDVIHRVTPLSPTYPSPIASWTDTPFVLGPLNGGLAWPKGTTKIRFSEMEWLSYIRGAYRFLPYVRSTYHRAAEIIAGSHSTLASIPLGCRERTTYIPENGIDATIFCPDNRTCPSEINPFRIIFVGRLVPYKQADVVIEAFGTSNRLRNCGELVIVGDGPEMHELVKRCLTLGIRDRVTFTGQLPQEALVLQFRKASVFAFPSLREFGGAVVMEAMGCGVPCVVVDHGGPGEIVAGGGGIRLPFSTRDSLVASLRDIMESFSKNRKELAAMSGDAVRIASEKFTWTVKAKQINEIYRRVCAIQR